MEGDREPNNIDNRSDLSEPIDGAKSSRSPSEPCDGADKSHNQPELHDASDKSCNKSTSLAPEVDKAACNTSNGGAGGIAVTHDSGTEKYLPPGNFSEPGILPGMYATGGSQIPELPDALKWLPINGENNTNGFSYNFAGMMSASDYNMAGIDAGTWGQANNFNSGVFDSTGLVTNKQSVSFTGMLYDQNTMWPDVARMGAVQHVGGQGQYATTPNILPLSGSPNRSEDPYVSTGVTTESSRYETTNSLISEGANTLAQSTPAKLASKGAAEPRVPGEKSSRFGRTITPSTRSEKMNQIGSTKENIPPVAPQQSTEWVTLVKEQMLQPNLGEDWRLCVEGWLALEELLDYGAKTKASSNSHSPSES